MPGREEITAEFERLARTTPERAARIILAGMRCNARRVLVNRDAWVIDRIQRWLPTGYQALLERVFRRDARVAVSGSRAASDQLEPG